MPPPVVGGEGHADNPNAPNAVAPLISSYPLLDPFRPANAIAETIPRWIGAKNSQASALVAGTLWVDAIALPAMVVQSITWHNTNAGAAMTNQWFVLCDPNVSGSSGPGPAVLGYTSDDGATAWAANTPKTLNMATPVRLTRPGLYLVGVAVAGTTAPLMMGFADGNGSIIGRAPALSGQSNSGLTTTASLGAVGVSITAPTGAGGIRTYATVQGTLL